VSLTVAAIQPPSAIYREEQRFAWWAYAPPVIIMLVGLAIMEGRGPAGFQFVGHRKEFVLGVGAGLVLPLTIVVGLLRMTTLVIPSDVRVWFGFIPTFRRSIPIGTIKRVEVVQYRPLADCGGWGIRSGRDGERVLNARGDRGVRLHLIDGSRVLIGSQRPEELALAVEGALRTGH
jgi:hypothetical protein